MANEPQLHEVIAVANPLKSKMEAILTETTHTFKAKPHMFEGAKQIFQPTAEEGGEETVEDSRSITDTVLKKLQYTFGHVVKAFDAQYQVAVGNRSAIADIVVDGETIAKDVPASFLLDLERNLLPPLRKVLLQIPTYDTSLEWEPDQEAGANILRTTLPVRVRTQRINAFDVVVPPTEHHRAEVREVAKDVPVGKIVKHEWTSKISPAEKSELLERLDTLIQAVKKARQRANKVSAPKEKIGSSIANFLLKT